MNELVSESKYTLELFNFYEQKLKSVFLAAEEKNDTEYELKLSAKDKMKKLMEFHTKLFTCCGKLILSGDFLINDIKKIDELSNDIAEVAYVRDDDAFEPKCRKFVVIVKDTLKLVKYHCINTRYKFELNEEFISPSGIKFDHNESEYTSLFTILEKIIEICWSEYSFSYDINFIKFLIKRNVEMEQIKENCIVQIIPIVDAAKEKIQFMLKKLAFFYKNRSIRYSFDFERYAVNLDNHTFDSANHTNLLQIFNYYSDPNNIPNSCIDRWNKNILEKRIEIWQITLLMRYYSKHPCSLQQINNITKIADRHFTKILEDNQTNMVDKYAMSSFINYMYNSRFSFICKRKDTTFDTVKNELESIESLQDKTNIHNYHPYHKATEYICNYLENTINAEKVSSKEELCNILSFLKLTFNHFKENVTWCRLYQPYLVQMGYDFSSVDKGDFKVFYPSSFTRPLKFGELDEDIRKTEITISMLEYHVNHIEEKNKLMSAQEKIDNMRKSNMKDLGLFSAILTFFVGMLTIFTGNPGTVPLKEKIQYSFFLGCILLFFVLIGAITISDINKWVKVTIYFILAIVILGIIIPIL